MIEKTIGRMPAPGEAVTSRTGRKNSAGTYIVRKAVKYIQENYRNRLTLAVVAEQLFVSQWHLSKLINRYTGNSFSELLNQVRIEEARKLLKDPKRRVGDMPWRWAFQTAPISATSLNVRSAYQRGSTGTG